MPIILHVGPLSTANPGFLDQGGQFLDIRQFFAIQGGDHSPLTIIYSPLIVTCLLLLRRSAAPTDRFGLTVALGV